VFGDAINVACAGKSAIPGGERSKQMNDLWRRFKEWLLFWLEELKEWRDI